MRHGPFYGFCLRESHRKGRVNDSAYDPYVHRPTRTTPLLLVRHRFDVGFTGVFSCGTRSGSRHPEGGSPSVTAVVLVAGPPEARHTPWGLYGAGTRTLVVETAVVIDDGGTPESDGTSDRPGGRKWRLWVVKYGYQSHGVGPWWGYEGRGGGAWVHTAKGLGTDLPVIGTGSKRECVRGPGVGSNVPLERGPGREAGGGRTRDKPEEHLGVDGVRDDLVRISIQVGPEPQVLTTVLSPVSLVSVPGRGPVGSVVPTVLGKQSLRTSRKESKVGPVGTDFSRALRRPLSTRLSVGEGGTPANTLSVTPLRPGVSRSEGPSPPELDLKLPVLSFSSVSIRSDGSSPTSPGAPVSKSPQPPHQGPVPVGPQEPCPTGVGTDPVRSQRSTSLSSSLRTDTQSERKLFQGRLTLR